MTPRIYHELAGWWPLFSKPEDYLEEAQFYWELILRHSRRQPETMLELGSGGGNNASHLKRHVKMTLVDISKAMLVVSQSLNPECMHVSGDMRTIRLDQEFDSVFIHDAIDYLLSLTDLHRAIESAFIHCRNGGVALFAPSYVKETFRPSTKHGGHDGPNRSLRYLEWISRPDPDAMIYHMDFVYLLRENNIPMKSVYDHHRCGLFSRKDWLATISSVGFQAEVYPFEHSEIEPGSCDVFVGVK
jgi:SAM-dependent methyltransferase